MSQVTDDTSVCDGVRALLQRLGGVTPAAKALDLSRTSVLAIAAGTRVQKGTIAQARAKLAEMGCG